MLPAFLSDRVPLTAARVQKRIRAGAPIYGTSPDRPTEAQRRTPLDARARLSPEAYGALFSAVPAARRVPPAMLGRAFAQSGGAEPRLWQDTGAVYTQAQIMLAAWGRSGGPVEPSDFGATDADITGTDTPRTRAAIASFQRWANGQTPSANIRDDGVLDDLTLGYLVTATADALQGQKGGVSPYSIEPTKTTKSAWPLWFLVGGTILAVAYSEYGGGRSK